MLFAEVASRRSTCPRADVGAVIVNPKTNRILSTGYNGAPPGEPHCTDVGCIMEDGHCQRALHAEVNAVVHAAKDIDGAVIYVYGKRDDGEIKEVCRECMKVLKAANVTVAMCRGD